MRIEGARVVVTGGASGLGRAVAEHFGARGARVVVFDRDPAVAGRAAAAGAEPGGEPGAGPDPAPDASPQAHGVVVDVTDAASVAAGIAAAVARLGGIDAVVNCAGIVAAGRVLGRDGPHPLDGFRRVLDVNLAGSFNVLRLAAEVMAANPGPERGVVINTASIAGFEGQAGQAAYAASKAGIAGMTLPLARDLARHGIRVCAIAPGIFATPMMAGMGCEVQQALAAAVPFPRRLGDPAEFAALAAFILDCGYLNGEVIRLDGALRMA
ncbi:SDR family NAD(P)-dependent oxidoreductase [Frigidibacter sp. MR17.24]|uniref:SDR family NAD(P)-dependent oxidoreductase n=1 Tax=Frigidibacter sp. MR17.24 TaxID=3127345 RepID=UPI003012F108